MNDDGNEERTKKKVTMSPSNTRRSRIEESYWFSCFLSGVSIASQQVTSKQGMSTARYHGTATLHDV